MNGKTTSGIEALKDVLDTYGADRTRWPAQVRRDLASLLQTSSEAQRLVKEAAALDRLIDLAPTLPAERLVALQDRIMRDAVRSPRAVAGNPNIVRAPAALPGPSGLRRRAAGMAALVASLMIGVWAGQSQTLSPAVSEVAAFAGIEIDATGQQVAAADEAEFAADEDML